MTTNSKEPAGRLKRRRMLAVLISAGVWTLHAGAWAAADLTTGPEAGPVTGQASSAASPSGHGPAPAPDRDLVKARMNEWEYEIERGALYVDKPGLEELAARAEAGDLVAMTTLGLIAENGEHAPRDYAAAARWYQRAASEGFAPAQTYLGELTATGRGVPRNFDAAEHLFRDAAEAGHSRAAMDLLDLRVRMGETPDPSEWVAVLYDIGRRPIGLPTPGVPAMQGTPDLPWMGVPNARGGGRR
ncbi:tetratricopeptide repeat protein [Achromobacter sp.]|uniref:tetratricopeptide repeat protein n=1 Tax=Achromobacter sp. TaxID=134375 RepID=UPI0028ABD3FC|nr:tetratricopeptide repeat protein [Achromobacter sp.]